MAARVLQVDLAEPLAPIRTSPRYSAYWILIRYGRQPLGWARCRRAIVGNVITPDMQASLIGEQLGPQTLDAIRGRTFLPVANPQSPSFSIVICTREHPDLLERQLLSMRRLEYPRYEIIVVDNAPRTNRTRAVCERFPEARYVVEPRKGLDFARNTGWQCATGEIVAYTDDDAIVDPHWLSGLAQPYVDPRVVCVTGITFPLELETDAQEFFEKYGGMQRGFQKRVYRPGTWNAFYPLGSGRFGAGVNLSLRRSTLAAMGGFDPALDVGSIARGGGDLDIMARAIRDGGMLVYEPRAVAWHQHRRTMSALRKQMFDYGWGFSAYSAKHSRDLELGNQVMKMLKRWLYKWGNKRLRENLRLALKLQPHFPVHLIVLEIMGGLLGFRAYKRSRKHARALAARHHRRYGIAVAEPVASTRQGVAA